MICRLLFLAGCCAAGLAAAPAEPAPAVQPEDTPAQPADTPDETKPAAEPEAGAPVGRPVTDWTEAQVALHRLGFSCGSIDGVRGPQTVAALQAFQRNEGLRETGELDEPTRAKLLVADPVVTVHTFTAAELGRRKPAPETWLEKSQRTELYYATALELAAERYHASPKLLQRLNPDFNWEEILPGMKVQVPAVPPFTTALKAARVHVRLAAHELEVTDETGRIILHCPVSIARDVEKRPVGELHVTVVIPDPDYTFDPAVYPESPEAQALGRKLIFPPGPNNPVGLAWIGLDRTGYGIHGTPDPEKVGRTESHGCFRLANWDAVALLALAWVGLPVVIEP
jgi:lipoprotein-anchoring transpeptidase ErfK/SrfK